MSRALAAVMLVVLSPTVAGSSHLPTQPADQVIPLSYGITRMRLAQGVPGEAMLAWRENYNAHGFDVLSIYAQGVKDDLVQDARLQIVPVFSGNQEQLTIRTFGGADCILNDFRLVRTGSGDVELVTAERELGDNFGAVQQVTFTYFLLERNTDQEAGRPKYYFERQGAQMSKKTYCDVEEAFKSELGLGSDGRWDTPSTD